MQQKTIVLIDGSNFYFKVKELKLPSLLYFDFSKFIKKLTLNNKLVWVKYYVGKIRTDGTPKVQRLFNQQRKLLAHLKKHGIQYSLGYLSESQGKFHEKGVDVQMATDMLVTAYENKCNQIILISSDTDLLPAIEQVKRRGKAIQYIGFSHQPSIALMRNCTTKKLLTKNQLQAFFRSK